MDWIKASLACIALSLMIAPSQVRSEPLKATGTIETYFSPNGGSTGAVVKEIGGAKTEILVQAYSFGSKPIAYALAEARKRGVKVELVLDKSIVSRKTAIVDFLAQAGIPIWIDDKHAVAHNKVMIIDHGTVITGSFNFRKKSEKKNAENLLVIKGNKPLADQYIKNYNEHKGHSVPYQAYRKAE